jgi:hypothetical protein
VDKIDKDDATFSTIFPIFFYKRSLIFQINWIIDISSVYYKLYSSIFNESKMSNVSYKKRPKEVLFREKLNNT